MLLTLLSITCRDARVRNWRYKIGVPSCSELSSVCSLLHLRWCLQSDRGWQGVPWSCTWPLLNLISSPFCLCSCLCQQWLLAVPWTSNEDHWIWCSVCLEPFPLSYWHNFLLHLLCVFVWFYPSQIVLFKIVTPLWSYLHDDTFSVNASPKSKNPLKYSLNHCSILLNSS